MTEQTEHDQLVSELLELSSRKGWSEAVLAQNLGESPQTWQNWKVRGIPKAKRFEVAVRMGVRLAAAFPEYKDFLERYDSALTGASAGAAYRTSPSSSGGPAGELFDLLAEAAGLFRFYQKSHEARGPEHQEKAARNAEIAGRIESALAIKGSPRAALQREFAALQMELEQTRLQLTLAQARYGLLRNGLYNESFDLLVVSKSGAEDFGITELPAKAACDIDAMVDEELFNGSGKFWGPQRYELTLAPKGNGGQMLPKEDGGWVPFSEVETVLGKVRRWTSPSWEAIKRERRVPVFPVIHHMNERATLEDVVIARDSGADGLFLISHRGEDDLLGPLSEKVREIWPTALIGINFLSDGAAAAMRAVDDYKLDMLWLDNCGVSSAGVQPLAGALAQWQQDRALRHKHVQVFGSVAFKHQAPEAHPDKAAFQAHACGFLPTTSGERTGSPPSIEKIVLMSQAVKGKLAIASGMTPENVAAYVPHLSAILVATGVSIDGDRLDSERLRQFVQNVRAVSA